jgi:hypothetical protein
VPAVPRLFLRDDACREEGAQDRLDGLAGNAGEALQCLKALLADVVAGEHGRRPVECGTPRRRRRGRLDGQALWVLQEKVAVMSDARLTMSTWWSDHHAPGGQMT